MLDSSLCRHLFTTDPKGRVKLWRLRYPSREIIESHEMVEGNPPEAAQASLIAEFVSNFSARIVCMDANLENEVLVKLTMSNSTGFGLYGGSTVFTFSAP